MLTSDQARFSLPMEAWLVARPEDSSGAVSLSKARAIAEAQAHNMKTVNGKIEIFRRVFIC